MTAATIDLKQYEGKKVLVTLVGEDEAIEGTLEGANSKALVFKRKGKAVVEFIEASELAKIELAPSQEAVLKAKRQDPVSIDNIKRHLVDRHGYSLADVNAMKSEDAFSFHESIDHSPLGHFHAVKPDKTAESTDSE
jgi:hypothetical protein